jgi:hypothetical protein
MPADLAQASFFRLSGSSNSAGPEFCKLVAYSDPRGSSSQFSFKARRPIKLSAVSRSVWSPISHVAARGAHYTRRKSPVPQAHRFLGPGLPGQATSSYHRELVRWYGGPLIQTTLASNLSSHPRSRLSLTAAANGSIKLDAVRSKVRPKSPNPPNELPGRVSQRRERSPKRHPSFFPSSLLKLPASRMLHK